VPRCGALSLLQKPLNYRGGYLKSCPALVYVGLGPVVNRARVLFKIHLIVVIRPLFTATLIVRRRYLAVVPRPMPAAQQIYLAEVYKLLPAAPLVVRCMYMAVMPRTMPAAVASWCCRRRFQQLACVRCKKYRRGAQVDSRGATQVLGRGVKAVARGSARLAVPSRRR
jgi:hypothetical protein